jgi:glycosyltransferase involved in cell wall biosynthesis
MFVDKLPISAIIVGYNEARFLPACLQGLSFCAEVLYYDLGSSDNSCEIANQFGAIVIHHERVLSCEWIHAKFAKSTKYEWILISDPDEVIDSFLAKDIYQIFSKSISDDVGAFLVPWIFYFKHQKLSGTAWGGVNKRVLIAHNQRFNFTADIHIGRHLNAGFRYEEIKFEKSNFIHHYWMQSYYKLFEKHLRYLNNEGTARYKIGLRTSLKTIIKEPIVQFRYSFFVRKGYRDGIVGLFLSFFWAWYQTSALISLYRHTISHSKNH